MGVYAVVSYCCVSLQTPYVSYLLQSADLTCVQEQETTATQARSSHTEHRRLWLGIKIMQFTM